jgi:hypothetical protein
VKVWWKSFFWIVVLNVGILSVAWEIGDRSGLAWGFLLALSINYYLALSFPLKKICPEGAQKLEGQDAWGLGAEVDELSRRLKIPRPTLYVWESPRIQCFVFSKWPGQGHVALSDRALKNLNPEEIQVLLAWSLLALRSGRVINWTYLGLFLHLILIGLSSVDRILSGMVTKRINRPHGATLWLTAPLIYMIQRLFCGRSEFYELDRALQSLGISPTLTGSVIKKIYFQNQTHPARQQLAFAHLYFSGQLPKGGFYPLLRLQPSFKNRLRRIYP